jgi:hypothetical protein
MDDDGQRREAAAQQVVNAARGRKSANEEWAAAIADARAVDVPPAMAVQRAIKAGISDAEVLLEILEALK